VQFLQTAPLPVHPPLALLVSDHQNHQINRFFLISVISVDQWQGSCFSIFNLWQFSAIPGPPDRAAFAWAGVGFWQSLATLCLCPSAGDLTPHSVLLKTKVKPQFERPVKRLSMSFFSVFQGSNSRSISAAFFVFTVRSAEGYKPFQLPCSTRPYLGGRQPGATSFFCQRTCPLPAKGAHFFISYFIRLCQVPWDSSFQRKSHLSIVLPSDRDSGFQFGFFGAFGISGNFFPRPLRPLR